MKLLIVDDEKYTREGIIGELDWKSLGITSLYEAKNGQEAFNFAIENPIDILLTDVKMPLMNGIDLGYKVQSLYPNCRIIFMSGYSDKAYLKSAIELNAVRYIEKPLDMMELDAALRKSISLVETDLLRERYLESSTPLLQNNLCIALTRHQNHYQRIKKQIRDYFPEFPQEGPYQTLMVKSKTKAYPLNHFISYEQIAEFLDHAGINGIYGFRDEDHLLIHMALIKDTHDYSQLSRLYDLRKILDMFIKEPLDYVLILGQKVESLTSIVDSYQDTVIASKRLFIHHNKLVLLPTQVTETTFIFNDSLYKTFKLHIMNHHYQEAKSLLTQLTMELRRQDSLLEEQIKSYYYHFLMLLIDINALMMNEQERQETLSLEDTSTFFNLSTMDDVLDFLLIKIESFKNDYEMPPHHSESCTQILTYIHNHYGNVDLSLKDISDEVHLSLSHMCVLFKKETDTTVNQYLNHYRIKRSLLLLADEDQKLHFIANQVGFNDGNYYAKLFKKTMGITPSAYRETITHVQMD